MLCSPPLFFYLLLLLLLLLLFLCMSPQARTGSWRQSKGSYETHPKRRVAVVQREGTTYLARCHVAAL